MKKHILPLIMILMTSMAFGQMIPESNVSPFYIKENVPQSPEISSLGTYGQFQASPYNGKANISIPLHTLDFDGVQIPITLSYNSSGVRVTQEASWVGLNWNLSTSFGISRTIYGADDFDNTPAPNTQPFESSIEVPENGYIYNFYEVPPTSNGAIPSTPVSYLHRVFNSFLNEGPTMPSREVDTQPDIFEANVFGSTYKFRLVKKGSSNIIEAKVFNNNNVKITLDLANMSFTLLDDKGFTYYFSSKERSTTFVPINGGSGFGTSNGPGAYPGFLAELRGDRGKEDEEVITHWHLDNVTSPLGETLSFGYTDGLSLTFPSPTQSDSFYTQIVNDYRTISNSKEPIGITTVTKHKYLTQIAGDFGSVDFELGSRQDLCTLNAIYKFAGYDSLNDADFSLYTNGLTVNPSDPDRSKKLNRILVKDLNGMTKKTITFNTSYFNMDEVNFPVKERYLRLKLDSVDINGRSYAFDYIESNGLAPKDSRSIDFWGFYNGVNNTNLIPTIGRFITAKFSSAIVTGQYFLKFNGGVRKSDFNYGKKGLLSRVTYPTKGTTEFTYEPHDIVLPSVPAFNIQEYVNINGIDRIKWTDMTDENRYNFTYQYLKYANDPNYNYYTLAEPERGNATEIPLLTGQPFTIEFTSEVTAIGTLSMATGENQPLPSHDLYYIENIDTGDRHSLINYLEGPTSTTYSVAINKSVFLNPGKYMIRYYYDSGPVITFLGDFTLHTYENINVNFGDFYERFEIGGARVSKITNRDTNGDFISALAYNYEYLEGIDGLKSSGKLMDDLIFFSAANGYHSYNPHSYSSQGLTFSSNSTLGNTPSAKGSHIGYSFVQEWQLDMNGNTLGRIDKAFKNNKNIYFTESWYGKPYSITLGDNNFGNYDVKVSNTVVLGLPPKYNFETSNGLVEKETVNNVAGDRVQETINEYQQLTGERDETYLTKFMPLSQTSLQSFLTYNQYFYFQMPRNFSDQYVRSHSETHEFLQGNYVKTEVAHTYDPNSHHIKKVETILNELDSYSNNLYYPYDLEVSSDPHMSDLRDENRLATVVSSDQYRNDQRLSLIKYGYEKSANTGWKTLASSMKTQKADNVLEDRIYYEKYDDQGNLLQSRQADGTPTAYIWGYNKQYPIAKLENAPFDTMTSAQLTFVTNAEAASDLDDDRTVDIINANGSIGKVGKEGDLREALRNLRNAFPDAMISTYTYDPLIGVTSMTDPRGYTIYYIYDGFNRLKEVRDRDNKLVTDYEYKYKGQ